MPFINPTKQAYSANVLGKGLGLYSGKIISARVEALLSRGRVRLVWRTLRIQTKAPFPLTTGHSVLLRAWKLPEGWRFHFLKNALASPHHRKNFAPPLAQTSSPLNILASSLLRAGLGLPDKAELDRRTALLKHIKGSRLRISRLQAELFFKGVDPSADFLEAFEKKISTNGAKEKHYKDRKETSLRKWASPPSAQILSEELNTDDSQADPLIRLFNRAKNHPKHWTAAQFSRQFTDRHFSAVLKFQEGGEQAMALSIQDGERQFEFLLEGFDTPRLSVYTGDTVKIDQKNWNLLAKKLHLIGMSLSDSLLPLELSDGFTTSTAPTKFSVQV